MRTSFGYATYLGFRGERRRRREGVRNVPVTGQRVCGSALGRGPTRYVARLARARAAVSDRAGVRALTRRVGGAFATRDGASVDHVLRRPEDPDAVLVEVRRLRLEEAAEVDGYEDLAVDQ